MSNLLSEKERLLEKKKRIASRMRALNEKERKIRTRTLIVFGAFCLEQLEDEKFRNLIKNLKEKGLKDADTIVSMLQKEREKSKKSNQTTSK